MEHYDGEFYTLRLFSPIEGEIYSLNSTAVSYTHLEVPGSVFFIYLPISGKCSMIKKLKSIMFYPGMEPDV